MSKEIKQSNFKFSPWWLYVVVIFVVFAAFKNSEIKFIR